jgi:TRAP transporter TAXI family solute receptor
MSRRVFIPIALLSLIAVGGIVWKVVSDERQVHLLTIATGKKGGDYYGFAQTLADATAKYQPNIQLKVVETSGSLENMQLLDQKKVDLAMVQNDTPTQPSARIVALLYSELFHLIAAENSGIKTVPDLKGKRLAVPVRGTGSYHSFEMLMEHYGLKPRDFKLVELSPAEANEGLRKGEVDAIFRSLALGNSLTRDLLQTTRAELVPVDQAAAMKISRPYLEETIIPKGAYRGDPPIPDRDLPTVGVQSALLTNQDVSPELIREITSLLFDRRYDLAAKNQLFANISHPDSDKSLGLPLHPGAQAYYDREKPDFVVANADFIALVMSVVMLFGSWLWDWRYRLGEKQKNRADRYNLEIVTLTERVRRTTDLEELENARIQLFEIFRKVLEDLDRDKLSPESYQTFTFPWQVAMSEIQHREMLLLNLPGYKKHAAEKSLSEPSVSVNSSDHFEE